MKKLSTALLAVAGIAAPFAADAGEWTKGAIAGFSNAWLYTPDSYAPRPKGEQKRALVVHLIGCGQVIDQAKTSSGWERAAEEYGMYVLIPAPSNPAHPNKQATKVECFDYGYDRSGNYGAAVPNVTNSQFIDHKKIIASPTLMMNQHSDIDPNQVYVAGLSAGGAVAQQVACMAPDIFHGVANAAGPGLNSRQAQAVAPLNGAGMVSAQPTESSMKSQCQSWIGSKTADFQKQVWGIVSDNNFLPVGGMASVGGVFTFSIFNDPTVWDGDKFCPTGYHTRTVNIMKDLIMNGSAELETETVETSANTTQGSGCSDSAADFIFDGSSDGSYGTDYSSVKCNLSDAKKRDWEATADIYRADSGHVQLVRIQQDTLRHAWPSGFGSLQSFLGCESSNIGGTVGSYTVADLGDTDSTAYKYLKNADGSWKMSIVENLPNGAIGCIYFNPIGVDFPMYMANLWNNNNPALGDAQGNNQAPVVSLALDVDDLVLEASGVITDDVAVDSASIKITNTTTGQTVANQNLSLNTNGSYSVIKTGLFPGVYEVVVTASDNEGAESTTTKTAPVGDIPNKKPYVGSVDIAATKNGCLSFDIYAYDDKNVCPPGAAACTAVVDKGPVSGVIISIDGKSPVDSESTNAEICDLEMGTTITGSVIAYDDIGAESYNKITFTVALPDSVACEFVEGTVADLYETNPELFTTRDTWIGTYYDTSGDGVNCPKFDNSVHKIYIGADGKGYKTEPEDCGSGDIDVETKNVDNGDVEEGEGEIEEGEGEIEEGEGEIEGKPEVEGQVEEGSDDKGSSGSGSIPMILIGLFIAVASRRKRK